MVGRKERKRRRKKRRWEEEGMRRDGKGIEDGNGNGRRESIV